MSQENVEVVRRAVEALERGRLRCLVGRSIPPRCARTSDRGPEGGPIAGHEGCRAFWRGLHDAGRTVAPRSRSSATAGDRRARWVRLQGVGKDSGVPSTGSGLAGLKVRDGQAICDGGSTERRRGPRSRGAVGVGDVAGERGDSQALVRRDCRGRPGLGSMGCRPHRRQHPGVPGQPGRIGAMRACSAGGMTSRRSSRERGCSSTRRHHWMTRGS